MQALVVLLDIRTIEKTIMKKLNYLITNVPDPEKLIHADPGRKTQRTRNIA
jgi:hypothetical protein